MESISALFKTGVEENWFRGRILFIQTSMENWKLVSSLFPNYLRGKCLPKLCINANHKASCKNGVIFALDLIDCKWNIQDIRKLLTELDTDQVLEYKGKVDYVLQVVKGTARIVISSSSMSEIIENFKSKEPTVNWQIIRTRGRQISIDHEFENDYKINYSIMAIESLLTPWKLRQIHYTRSGPVEKIKPIRCGKMVVPKHRPIGGVKMPYPPVVEMDGDDSEYDADDEDTEYTTD